jgi:hypothetical protein
MNQQYKMAKQMIDMQRASCTGMINALITVWEQTGTFLESAPWFPEEGRKAFRQWADINKKACENLKSAIDSGYSSVEKFFTSASQKAE